MVLTAAPQMPEQAKFSQQPQMQVGMNIIRACKKHESCVIMRAQTDPLSPAL